MTSYAVHVAGSSITGSLGLRAVTYPVRINKILFPFSYTLSGNGFFDFTVTLQTGASLSGGTLLPVVPLRQGAPAATATARAGAITVSGGTARTIQNLAASGSGYGASSVEFAPPLDLLINPGDVVHTDGLKGGSMTSYPTIYFEEIRLAWNY